MRVGTRRRRCPGRGRAARLEKVLTTGVFLVEYELWFGRVSAAVVNDVNGGSMSYAFLLFEPALAKDGFPERDEILESTARALYDEACSDHQPGPPMDYKEARKMEVSTALKSMFPELEVSRFDYETVASLKEITLEEAKARYRGLQLSNYESDLHIVVDLYDDVALVCLPFGHEPDAARAAFTEIWGYLQIVEQASNYVTFDMQLSRRIDFSSDFADVLTAYNMFHMTPGMDMLLPAKRP